MGFINQLTTGRGHIVDITIGQSLMGRNLSFSLLVSGWKYLRSPAFFLLQGTWPIGNEYIDHKFNWQLRLTTSATETGHQKYTKSTVYECFP